MAIPGLRPSFEVRAKVRVGEKGRTAGGKEYPKSTDHFVCDDPDFVRVAGAKPKELTVSLPFEAAEDNFSTGLEQWQGAMLVCYAKGDQVGGQNAAFRKATMKKGGREVNLLDGFTVLGDTMGNDRRPVACAVRECALMKSKDCKPMGRLQFFIDGIDPSKGVYQLDTKSWNTVEKITAFLSVLGDPRGQKLTLRVEMWARGTSKFPVVTLEGGNVEIQADDPNGVAKADRAVMMHKALADNDEAQLRNELAAMLDLTTPTWREMPELIAKLQEVGVVEASKSLLTRLGL